MLWQSTNPNFLDFNALLIRRALQFLAIELAQLQKDNLLSAT